MSDHVVPVKVYVAVFLALVVLTVVTVVAATYDFGPLNVIVALGIAITKATLVVLYFMHLRYDAPIYRRLFLIGLVSAPILLGAVLFTFGVLIG